MGRVTIKHMRCLSLADNEANGLSLNGQPVSVSGMKEDAANEAREHPVQQGHSSPGTKWTVSGKARKLRNPVPARVTRHAWVVGFPCDTCRP